VTPDSDDIDHLRAILGHRGVLSEAADRCAYETPARYAAGVTPLVLRPADTPEVARVLAYCADRGLRLALQSGNTGLVLGSTPDASGEELVLSLDRLQGIVEIAPSDRSVTVQAGVRLSALNAALEPYGLFLPIDLGADPMIGGMVATNTGGARFLRYGDMRDQVLGLEVVLDDGEVLTLGSGLRKDNSRLDLMDLFIGSCGALGVVTAATLQVHPRPWQTAVALIVPTAPEASLAILSAIERSAPEFLSAFEGMSGAAISRALTHVPALQDPFAPGQPPGYALLVEFACGAAKDQLDLDDLLAECLAPLLEGEARASDILIAPPAKLWALRHALSEGLRASGHVIGLDLAFRRDRVFPFRAAAMDLLAEHFPEVTICDFGHVADGGLHFNLVAPHDTPAARAAQVRASVNDLAAARFGGSFSGEHGLGRLNQDAYDRYVPSSERARAGAVAALFSRGRLGAARYGLSRRKAE
jgi:FAD/FMN-containing dehydrogenase